MIPFIVNAALDPTTRVFVLIATPLLALIKNIFDRVDANGVRLPSFRTKVLLWSTWAYFPAANDSHAFT